MYSIIIWGVMWEEFQEEMGKGGLAILDISKDIEKGVEQGYSVEMQLELCKIYLKKMFN
jgi:hypothetical protein